MAVFLSIFLSLLFVHFRTVNSETFTNGENDGSLATSSARRALDEQPMPAAGGKWIIGVPMKTGFKGFVNIDGNNVISGFSIDLFKAVWEASGLHPGDYEFKSIDKTYDELCCQVKDKKIDIAVGDISILAIRTNCVDFTLPYMQSDLAMLIKERHDGPRITWSFLQPFSEDLWVTIIIMCILIGIVIWLLERRQNTEFNGPPGKLLSTILVFPFQSVATPQRDMVVTSWSRFVVILWMLLACILIQTYTANLSSVLTVNRLQPAVPSWEELRTQYVGYHNESFVKGFLLSRRFQDSLLKPYGSVQEYHEALSNGSVAAIFDVTPYIKLFLDMHTTGFKMVGPTYRTDGFGFAFPIGSTLVAKFSRAILNFTQGNGMDPLKKKYFRNEFIDEIDICPTASRSNAASTSSSRISTKELSGLFTIVGIALLLALISSEVQRYIFRNSHEVPNPRSSDVQPTEAGQINNDKSDGSTEEATLEELHIHS